MMRIHKDKTSPKSYAIDRSRFIEKEDYYIFVFGSNEAGIHGAGAAHAAISYFGAEPGKGKGLVGQSYAIPTKDNRIQTLPLYSIEKHIRDFCNFYNCSKLNFFLTRIGCGLAGYSDNEIAPIFVNYLLDFDRLSIPKEWEIFFKRGKQIEFFE